MYLNLLRLNIKSNHMQIKEIIPFIKKNNINDKHIQFKISCC